jgi:hypothetical protein
MTPTGEAIGTAIILTGTYALHSNVQWLVAVWGVFVVLIGLVAWWYDR